MYEVISNSLKELEQGKNIVLVIVVNTKGSTPQKIGSKLLVRDDGSTVGTLGGGCVEGDIWFESKSMLEEDSDSETRFREYTLNQELAEQEGLVCGGTMYFLLDKLIPENQNIEHLRSLQNSLNGKDSGKSILTLVNTQNKDLSIGIKKTFDFENTNKISNDEEFMNYLLDSEGIAGVHGAAFGLSPYFRLSYATSDEILTDACKRIKRACEKLK